MVTTTDRNRNDKLANWNGTMLDVDDEKDNNTLFYGTCPTHKQEQPWRTFEAKHIYINEWMRTNIQMRNDTHYPSSTFNLVDVTLYTRQFRYIDWVMC